MNLTWFADAHTGAYYSQPTTVVFSATWSHVSMWWEQTCFVCFHNLLVDHLRPSEQPSLQSKWGRKPGLGTKRRTKPSLPPGRASFPHKVGLAVELYVCLYGQCLPLHFLQSRLQLQSSILMCVGPCMTVQTGMRNRQWCKYVLLIRGLPQVNLAEQERWRALCRPGPENQGRITNRNRQKNRRERKRKCFYKSLHPASGGS